MDEYNVKHTREIDTNCILTEFISSLEFIYDTEEFTTFELQCYLKCSYNTVIKILDALCLLCVVTCNEDSDRSTYKRLPQANI
jgi:hypothetical protein